MEKQIMEVWVFNGSNSKFPTGAFSERKNAENWIKMHKLSGILSLYPLNEGIYDWAIRNNFFSVKKATESEPGFIQRFTSASQEHYHYENGELE